MQLALAGGLAAVGPILYSHQCNAGLIVITDYNTMGFSIFSKPVRLNPVSINTVWLNAIHQCNSIGGCQLDCVLQSIRARRIAAREAQEQRERACESRAVDQCSDMLALSMQREAGAKARAQSWQLSVESKWERTDRVKQQYQAKNREKEAALPFTNREPLTCEEPNPLAMSNKWALRAKSEHASTRTRQHT